LFKINVFHQRCITEENEYLATNTNKQNLAINRPETRLEQMAYHLVKQMPFGIILFDSSLQITDANACANDIMHDHENIADALAAGTAVTDSALWCEQLCNAVAKKEVTTFEKVRYTNGDRNYVLHIICSTLTCKISGQQCGTLIIEDITAQIVLENDLAASERLAAVGKLASKVAHELNNPLDGILRYVNLSMRVIEQKEPEKAINFLKESTTGLLRMAKIIGELLEFSRLSFSAFEEANVNKIIEDAIVSMDVHAIENNVTVRRNFTNEMPNIRSGNLIQVFSNLIKNGIDAMGDGGILTVTTRCDSHTSLIEFADTGDGIAPENMKKLFEPFYTTKAEGKGTGLGLAICKDIINKYHGKISVDQNEPQGALFTVSIPVDQDIE
jgi:nitrogen fixation/metabolism regulation signal transduction histidine kinase